MSLFKVFTKNTSEVGELMPPQPIDFVLVQLSLGHVLSLFCSFSFVFVHGCRGSFAFSSRY